MTMDREIAEQMYDPKRKSEWYDVYLKGMKRGKVKAKSLSDAKIKAYMAFGTSYTVKVKPSVYDPAPKRSVRAQIKRAAHGLSRPPKNWFYAMLQGIKKGSDVTNPAAVVGSIWKRLSPSKRADIKRRELKGEQFKYDLPLPDDRRTRGVGTVRMVKPFKLAEVQVNLSVSDYLAALKSGLFSKMRRGDGTIALVARCKSPRRNVNVFIDQVGK